MWSLHWKRLERRDRLKQARQWLGFVAPGGTGKHTRWIDIHEDDLDEELLADLPFVG